MIGQSLKERAHHPTVNVMVSLKSINFDSMSNSDNFVSKVY